MSHQHMDKKVLQSRTAAAAPEAEEVKRLNAQALMGVKDSLESESRLIDTMKFQTEEDSMSTWVRDYKIPDKATLEASYDESRAVAFGNAQLNLSHQAKRKSSYMDKAKIQTSACGMVKAAYTEREQAKDAFLTVAPRVQIEEKDVSFMQDWCTLCNTGEFATGELNLLSDIFSDDYKKQHSEALNLANWILGADISEFDYTDDTDFLHKFRDKYKTLCAFSNIDKILSILDNGLPEERLNKLKARAKALGDIREDYENRMQIMQSPYYALLVSTDVSGDNFKKLEIEMGNNPVFKAYADAVKKRDKMTFGKGQSASELEAKYISEDPKLKEIEEHRVFEAQFDTFLDKSVYSAKDQTDPAVIWLNGTVASFKGVLKRDIPTDPDEVLPALDAILSQYVQLLDGLDHYIGGVSTRSDLTKQDKENLKMAQELLPKFQDEQTIFLDAYDKIKDGQMAGLSGPWETILYISDKEQIFKPASAEDSAMRIDHLGMLSAKEEILQSKKTHMGIEFKDSDEMAKLKDSLAKLNILLDSKATADTKADLIDKYQDVIDNSVAYRDMIASSRIKGISSAGKRRYELSKGIIMQAYLEQQALKKMSDKELRIGEDLKWSEIFYGIRAMKVSSEDANVTVVGAGASTIFRVSHENAEPTYVKRCETMLRVEDDIWRVCNMYETGGTPKMKEIAKTMREMQDVHKINGLRDRYLDNIVLRIDKARLAADKLDWEEGESEEEFKKRQSDYVRDSAREMIKSWFGTYEQPFLDFVKSNLEDFIDYMLFYFKKVNEYNNATDGAHIDPGLLISDRNVSTSRLAKQLGVSEIIAESRTVLLHNQDGTVSRANEMEGVETRDLASLQRYCKHNKLTLKYSPNAIRQLSTLQVFDQICGQVDRHQGNYNAFFEESAPGEITITSIKAIDNDLAFGELSYKDVLESASRLRGLVVDGLVTVPFLDRAFYDQIQSLDLTSLDLIGLDQKDLRTDGEIAALKDRLLGIKGDLLNLVQNGWITLIDKPEDWAAAADSLKKMRSEGKLGAGYYGEHDID